MKTDFSDLVPENVEIHEGIAKLPLCDLHYIETGSGPPLIIVPATMSEVQDWSGLAAFMGQRFRTFFFELPGHGQSTPLEHYSSEQMAQVIADLMDHFGFGHANLMGFSFGGILALTVLKHLAHRIDRVILISPLVDSAAIRMPPMAQRFVRALLRTGQNARLQRLVHRSIKSEIGSTFWAQFAVKVGNIEYLDVVKTNLQATSIHTIQALVGQLNEIFNTRHFVGSAHHTQPCYFAMSMLDPLIDFSFTSAAVGQIFSNVEETRLDLPYHRPRDLPSMDYLNQTYPHLLDSICQGAAHVERAQRP